MHMFGVPAASMACLVTCRCNFLVLLLAAAVILHGTPYGNDPGQTMISINNTAMRTFFFAGSVLCAAAHADTPPAR